ncbi:MAG: PAS domain S-box protein, partial [Nitrospirota bacterium]|nr:PAS domain S-box protein [Nitrospirota bacterium]
IRIAATDGPQRFEWQDLDRHGRVYWRDISLNTITLDGIMRVVAITQDITERKRVEDALAESRQFLETIVETAPS